MKYHNILWADIFYLVSYIHELIRCVQSCLWQTFSYVLISWANMWMYSVYLFCMTYCCRQLMIHHASHTRGGGYGIHFFHSVSEISQFDKTLFTSQYHTYVGQVSPQYSCGYMCPIWMKFKLCDEHFVLLRLLLTNKARCLNFNHVKSWFCH